MSDSSDVLGELNELIAEGEALRARSDVTRREILGLLEIRDTGVVEIVYDADGLMSTMTIDHEARTGLTAAQLVNEINTAILRSSTFVLSSASPDVTSPDGSRPANSLLSQVLAATSSGELPEPELVQNDFKTVTVSALWGNVTGIRCETNWVNAASDRALSEEIVRMARVAALVTDTFGRFSNRS